MKAIDMSSIYKKYKGMWVALKSPSGNKVVGSGNTFKQALTSANKKGIASPVLTYIPKKILPHL